MLNAKCSLQARISECDWSIDGRCQLWSAISGPWLKPRCIRYDHDECDDPQKRQRLQKTVCQKAKMSYEWERKRNDRVNESAVSVVQLGRIGNEWVSQPTDGAGGQLVWARYIRAWASPKIEIAKKKKKTKMEKLFTSTKCRRGIDLILDVSSTMKLSLFISTRIGLSGTIKIILPYCPRCSGSGIWFIRIGWFLYLCLCACVLANFRPAWHTFEFACVAQLGSAINIHLPPPYSFDSVLTNGDISLNDPTQDATLYIWFHMAWTCCLLPPFQECGSMLNGR